MPVSLVIEHDSASLLAVDCILVFMLLVMDSTENAVACEFVDMQQASIEMSCEQIFAILRQNLELNVMEGQRRISFTCSTISIYL